MVVRVRVIDRVFELIIVFLYTFGRVPSPGMRFLNPSYMSQNALGMNRLTVVVSGDCWGRVEVAWPAEYFSDFIRFGVL